MCVRCEWSHAQHAATPPIAKRYILARQWALANRLPHALVGLIAIINAFPLMLSGYDGGALEDIPEYTSAQKLSECQQRKTAHRRLSLQGVVSFSEHFDCLMRPISCQCNDSAHSGLFGCVAPFLLTASLIRWCVDLQHCLRKKSPWRQSNSTMKPYNARPQVLFLAPLAEARLTTLWYVL
jgi:hypothetical protein